MKRRAKKREPTKRQAKRRGQIHDFCSKIGMSPRQIFLAAGLVAILSGVIAWVLISESLSSANEASQRSVDEFNERASVDDQLNQLGELPVAKGNRLAIVAELKQRVTTLETLPQTYTLTYDQQQELNRVKLFNLRNLTTRLIAENIDFSQEVDKLLTLASELLKDSDESTRNAAANAICFVNLTLFAQRPEQAQLDSLSECLVQHKDAFINNEARATEFFRVLMRLRRKDAQNRLLQSAFKKLADVYSASTETKVSVLAQSCLLMAELSEFNFRYLEEMVRFDDPKAESALADVVAAFKSNPGTVTDTWKILLRACEAYLARGNIPRLKKLNDELAKLAQSISLDNNSEVVDLIARQRTRLKSIGKPFDIAGEWLKDVKDGSAKSSPIVSKGKYTAILFSNGKPRSASEVKTFTERTFDTSACQYVVALEDPPNDARLTILKRLDPKIQIANASTVESYHRQIPIDFWPYTVLVDPAGNVVALNFSATQLQSQLPKKRLPASQ